MLKLIQGTFVPDEWHSEHGYEALLDFEISWILRLCSKNVAENYKKKKILIYQCRLILQKLTNIDPNIVIDDVKVWRQWNCIDVIAEIYVGDVLHVLVLEDKAYTSMRQNQRDEYPKRVFDYYGKTPGKKIDFHFGVITFFESHEEEYKNLMSFVKKSDGFGPNNKYCWNVFSATALPDWDVDDYTESDLFNEFWFAKW